jgi:hypothetical protein
VKVCILASMITGHLTSTASVCQTSWQMSASLTSPKIFLFLLLLHSHLFLGTGFSLVCVYVKGGGRERDIYKKKRFLLVFNVFLFLTCYFECSLSMCVFRYICAILAKLAKCHDKYFGKCKFGEYSKNAWRVFQVCQVTTQNQKRFFFWQMRVLAKIGEIW